MVILQKVMVKPNKNYVSFVYSYTIQDFKDTAQCSDIYRNLVLCIRKLRLIPEGIPYPVGNILLHLPDTVVHNGQYSYDPSLVTVEGPSQVQKLC
jgi:hypothetical protein